MELDLGPWTVSRERVSQYLAAVGDRSPGYLEWGLAPPLALAAYALGSLLEKLSLPPGAVHTLQEVETLRPVRLGEVIRGFARLERARQRGELRFTTATFTLLDRGGQAVLRGKSTVLVAGGEG